jgi:hypothetical protein
MDAGLCLCLQPFSFMVMGGVTCGPSPTFFTRCSPPFARVFLNCEEYTDLQRGQRTLPYIIWAQ